jgi:DnaA family protein
MRQLLLDLIPDNPPTLDNFAPGGNADALTALLAWLSPENRETGLLLWGDTGAGKTHLLRGSGGSFHDAAANPTLSGIDAEPSLLAIDNVQALDDDGQIALFNLFNRLRAAGRKLLVSAAQPPLQLELREDLRTRLGSGLIFRLRPLSDEEKIATLGAQAEARGMRLAALDRYSLEQKRPLTLPLLREVLHTPQPQEN